MNPRIVGVFFGAALVLLFGCSEEVLEGTNQDDVRTETNSGDHEHNDGDGDWEEPDIDQCEPGEVLGCAGDGAMFYCNDEGDGTRSETCPSEAPRCIQGECTDRICNPGRTACLDADTVQVCNEDGTAYESPSACPQGTICEEGGCQSLCQLGSKMVSSYFGCEYWTVYLDQYDDPFTTSNVPHAIVLSNPNDTPATVSFQSFEAGVSFDIADPVVPPKSARSFTMPRLALEETGITQRGIFVQSSLPVTAHQFNPLNNQNVYSNDASLLLPVSSLGKEYYAMSWPTQVNMSLPGMPSIAPQRAFLTIVAASPGLTHVVVNSTAQFEGGPEIAPFGPGVGRNFELQYGDVLNLSVNSGQLGSSANDLTGTHILSDQPIAVFAGHEQAVIGYDSSRGSCCADHIEQQMFPLDSWGERYVAAFSPGRTNTKDHWRIMAGEDNVTVTTNPPQPGANGVVLNRGEFVTFFSDQNFEVQGTGKILVGQFLVGQDQTAEVTGDPAFILAVPVERWRDDYYVLTPQGYSRDFVTVIRPAGLVVSLDGVALSEAAFVAVGDGEFEVGSFEVTPGVHELEAAEPFGVLAYGLDNAVSYGYPGGLNVVGSEDN